MFLPIAAWILSSLHFTMAGYAVIQSLIEKRMRAAALFSVGLLPPVLVWTILLKMQTDGMKAPLMIYAGFSILILIFILLPVPHREEPVIRSDAARVDERDAVFHRFYRLEKNTEAWDTFYGLHPELQDSDEKTRAMPQLQEPGSRSYDTVTSPFSHAAFDLTARLADNLDEVHGMRSDPVPLGPKEAAIRLSGLARHLGAVEVGTTQLNPAWIYSHIGRSPGKWGDPIKLDHQWAIVIAVKMDHAMIQCAPENTVITESAAKYAQAALIARILARTIKHWGYRARAHVDSNYRVLCVPIAADAGLGEVGRHGLLITPKYGSRVRLAVVTTDLQLPPSYPVRFGMQRFCRSCQKCARNCPSGAIPRSDGSIVNGVLKWQIDRESCYRFWRQQGTDCGLCIRVCPYSHPDNPLHRSVRWLLNRNGFLAKPAVALDDILYGRKPGKKPAWPAWHAPSIG